MATAEKFKPKEWVGEVAIIYPNDNFPKFFASEGETFWGPIKWDETGKNVGGGISLFFYRNITIKQL